MRILYLLLLLFLFQPAYSATYYFSANAGDDSRSQTEAQNPSTPWQTLKKLNSFFISLKPGDSVLLNRGETFYGSIIVNRSGTSGSPIVIGDYGTGNKPVITSLITLSDWVFKSKGIWESYNPLGLAVNTVLINKVEQELGRFPNSGNNNKGYLNFETHVGTTSINDNDLTSKIDWTGAELVLRSRRWVLDKDSITNHSGNQITYKTSSQYAPYDKQGYFIQKDIRTLDKFGEWYYNRSTNKLSVYFGSNNPSSYNLEVTTVGNVVSTYRNSNVVFNNLNIKGANDCGFNIRGGSNITIQNCDIAFSGRNGVRVTSHTNFRIEGCTISNSNNNGIDLGYNGDNAVIRRNKIINTAMFAGMIGSGDGKGLGISSNGNGNIIEYNEIVNTGYMPINFNGNNVTVKNNFISNFCLIKDDGAGIYSHIGNSKPCTGRKVIGNIILNGIGAGEGTSNPSYSPAEGIYLDNNASDIEVTGNTIANCNNNGIYIHNAYSMIINNNTIYNNTKQLNVVEDSDNSRVRNCVFTNNIFFSKIPSQVISNLKASGDDINLFGEFNQNYYARPLDDRIGIISSYVNSNEVRVNQNFDLNEWKNKYGQDKDSKKTFKQVAPYKLNKLIGSNKIDNGTFSSGISGATGTACEMSWGNSGLIDGGYLEIAPKLRGSSVSLNIGSIKAGKNYILKYSVRGAIDSSTVIGTFLRQNDPGSGYNRLTPLQYRRVSIDRSDKVMLFSSATDENSVVVVFKVDDRNKYYLDNIQILEADATVTNPDDSIRFEYNATNVNKKVSLNGSYIDVKGKKYNNSITLRPYTSVILIKNDKEGQDVAQENLAPLVKITSPNDGKSFAANATINISADASDDDGSISKVEFFNDKTLIGTKTSSPYTFSWSNMPKGTYTITAKATDNDGLTAISDAVEVTVRQPDGPPVVRLKTPENNTSYSGTATININAAASDANGTITKVEFYNGSTLLHTQLKAPYNYTWSNVPNGTYTITAKATDNDGLQTKSDAVKVTVGSIKGAPIVNIINPASGDNFKGLATIRLIAKAYDTDGSISKVQFFNGPRLLHTEYEAPYTHTWDNVPVGDYQIVAVATDNDGNVTSSDIVSVSVVGSNATIVSSRPALKDSETSSLEIANNSSLSLKLSPIPAHNILNVLASGFQQDEKATISILSSSGTVVKNIKSTLTSSQTIQVDVSSLNKGVYIVKVISGNKVKTQQFVKL